MCGRFTLKTNPSQWGQLLLPNLDMGSFEQATSAWVPRYNIAPTQAILGLLGCSSGADERWHIQARALRWGLVPFWADDLSIGNRMINARAETLSEKPAFRTALAKQRCVVPADGYYEWQLQGKRKQPYWIHRSDQQPFALAALWDRNRKASEQEFFSTTIITGSATDQLAPIHDRMPAILSGDALAQWLDPHTSAAAAQELLATSRDTDLQATPVSTHVNNPRHEDSACLEPPAS